MGNELGEFLREKRGKMSLREFAAKCGISHTHLDSLEKGADPRTGKKVSVSTETLRLIADGIGVDFLYLACLADGIDPNKAEGVISPDGNEEITMDEFAYAMYEEGKGLNDESKKKILEMAKFFKQQQEKDDPD